MAKGDIFREQLLWPTERFHLGLALITNTVAVTFVVTSVAKHSRLSPLWESGASAFVFRF